jgi:hypothetical protein
MHRSSLTEHGLLIAAAALACLAVAPTATAQGAPPDATSPAAAALALVDDALAGMPPLEVAAAAAQLATVPPATAETTPVPPAPVAAPEAVPAAAAEPNPAMEPHPSPPPPPPQPEVLTPLEAADELAPISVQEVASLVPSAAPEASEPPQYQPATPQYQPPAAAVVPQEAPVTASPPAAAPEQKWSWDWTWSCGGSKPATQPPSIPGGGLPENWSWNWNWNCGPAGTPGTNNGKESGAQYQSGNTRYQPVNVNVSIRIGSPGDDGAVAQTNVVLAVEAGPASATVAASVPAPSSAPAAPPPAATTEAPVAADVVKKTRPANTKLASRTDAEPGLLSAPPVAAEASHWSTRPVVSRQLQPTHPEATASRPQLRRPTRRPLPPRRAPAIPAGSAGASPLGGSDGGGFQIALLLVPFALALVDSVRRSVRDITPPVGRAFRSRQERPG